MLVGLALIVRAARKDSGVLLDNQQWGARFLAREDPYLDPAADERMHGPYPPSLAWVAVPLAALPTGMARVAWAGLQVGALVVFFRLVRDRLARHWPGLRPHASVVFALALVLVSRYVLRDTAGGGGNLVYAALALFGLELALRGREGWAGLPLALSLVIKPNLALLCLFLGLRRRWRALASTLGMTLVLFLLPGLYFGPRSYAQLATRWAGDALEYARRDDLFAQGSVPSGLPPPRDGMNQSLAESVHRLLCAPADADAFDVHLFEVSPAAAGILARALGLALLAGTGLVALRARGACAEWLALLAFFPLSLLLSPVTWKAHHASLLASAAALVAVALAEPAARRWLPPFLGAYWVLCGLLSEEVVGAALRDRLQALSVVGWMDVAWLLALAWASLRADASGVERAGPR